MITQQTEELLLRIVWCPLCNKKYASREKSDIGCLVNHGPGSCCHFGDIHIADEKYENIKRCFEENVSTDKEKTT